MGRVEFGEILDEEWLGVDPENWVVEKPQDWTFTQFSHVVPFRGFARYSALLSDVLEQDLPSSRPYALRRMHVHPRAEISARFEALADEWRRETILDSSIQRRVMHRSYQQIIGMGRSALPLIISRLRDEPDYWFWALTAITGEDPASGETTLAAARDRWLHWAEARGL